jgi:hypothetical protein
VSITVVTRREIFDYLRQPGFAWHGRLDEPTFLGRLYDLAHMPSNDRRFPDALEDITQHRVRNQDGDDDWIFSDPRLQLGSGPDEILLEFLVQMVHPAVQSNAGATTRVVETMNELLAVDGWRLTQSGSISGRAVFVPARLGGGTGALTGEAHAVASRADSAYISRQVTRMQGTVDTDPDLAIGTAKEFVETICKTILEDRYAGYDKNDDLQVLVRKTTKELQLRRDDIDPAATAADTIRRVLSNLAGIAQGVAELRNAYGTGHGRPGGGDSGLRPRHARLVVGAAITLGSFLYETHEERPTTA